MRIFVDTSAWYAVADSGDRSNRRAKEVLSATATFVTSDHVLLETWLLLRHRVSRNAAERFWKGLRSGAAHVEVVLAEDLEHAWEIGLQFPDQDFSLTDRTSFALMQRLQINRVASFDDDFAVFRYGRDRSLAFEVIR
jgi:predicted nucleic acid-binding protein